MTLMEVVLWIALVIAIIFGLRSSVRLAKYRFEVEHVKRIPATGTFKIRLPLQQWDAGFRQGAFAFGIKDEGGKVIMTMTVEKGD